MMKLSFFVLVLIKNPTDFVHFVYGVCMDFCMEFFHTWLNLLITPLGKLRDSEPTKPLDVIKFLINASTRILTFF